MAVFSVGDLGERNWAILHSSGPFGISATRALLSRRGWRLLLASRSSKATPRVWRGGAASDTTALASYVSFEPNQFTVES
jgi:hypothetical protein